VVYDIDNQPQQQAAETEHQPAVPATNFELQRTLESKK